MWPNRESGSYVGACGGGGRPGGPLQNVSG